jgi:hypothetical protein
MSKQNIILGLKAKHNISLSNILGMNLVLFNSLSLVLFYEVSFVYLLQSDKYFNVPTDEASIVAGDLIFYT